MPLSAKTSARPRKERWFDIPLEQDNKDQTAKQQEETTTDGDWELVGPKKVQKHASMTLPCQSPYIEEKALEDVKIVQRQTKSEIDSETWEITFLGHREEQPTLLAKVQEAEDAIQEEIVRLIHSFKTLLCDTEDEEAALQKLEDRKYAIRRAREILGARIIGYIQKQGTTPEGLPKVAPQ